MRDFEGRGRERKTNREGGRVNKIDGDKNVWREKFEREGWK